MSKEFNFLSAPYVDYCRNKPIKASNYIQIDYTNSPKNIYQTLPVTPKDIILEVDHETPKTYKQILKSTKKLRSPATEKYLNSTTKPENLNKSHAKNIQNTLHLKYQDEFENQLTKEIRSDSLNLSKKYNEIDRLIHDNMKFTRQCKKFTTYSSSIQKNEESQQQSWQRDKINAIRLEKYYEKQAIDEIEKENFEKNKRHLFKRMPINQSDEEYVWNIVNRPDAQEPYYPYNLEGPIIASNKIEKYITMFSENAKSPNQVSDPRKKHELERTTKKYSKSPTPSENRNVERFQRNFHNSQSPQSKNSEEKSRPFYKNQYNTENSKYKSYADIIANEKSNFKDYANVQSNQYRSCSADKRKTDKSLIHVNLNKGREVFLINKHNNALTNKDQVFDNKKNTKTSEVCPNKSSGSQVISENVCVLKTRKKSQSDYFSVENVPNTDIDKYPYKTEKLHNQENRKNVGKYYLEQRNPQKPKNDNGFSFQKSGVKSMSDEEMLYQHSNENLFSFKNSNANLQAIVNSKHAVQKNLYRRKAVPYHNSKLKDFSVENKHLGSYTADNIHMQPHKNPNKITENFIKPENYRHGDPKVYTKKDKERLLNIVAEEKYSEKITNAASQGRETGSFTESQYQTILDNGSNTTQKQQKVFNQLSKKLTEKYFWAPDVIQENSQDKPSQIIANNSKSQIKLNNKDINSNYKNANMLLKGSLVRSDGFANELQKSESKKKMQEKNQSLSKKQLSNTCELANQNVISQIKSNIKKQHQLNIGSEQNKDAMKLLENIRSSNIRKNKKIA